MVSLAVAGLVDGLRPESGPVLLANAHAAVHKELRLRNNLSGKELEDIYRLGGDMSPMQDGAARSDKPPAIPEEKVVVSDLRLPGKVLKKLSKLTSWGRSSSASVKSSGSDTDEDGGGKGTAHSVESKARPPLSSRQPAASLDRRVSTEIRRPSTTARLSLDLPGASKCAKRMMPDMPPEDMGPMKKSTSTENLTNLYSNFLSILSDSPAVLEPNGAPEAESPVRPVTAGGRRSSGSRRNSGVGRAPRRPAFSRGETSEAEALPWDQASPEALSKPPTDAVGEQPSDVVTALPGTSGRGVGEEPAAEPVSEPGKEVAVIHNPPVGHTQIDLLAKAANPPLPAQLRPSEELRSSEEELFYRLSRARQTMDFVRRQYERFGTLDRAELNLFEALRLLNTMQEYEAVLLGDDTEVSMSFLEHAFQTAEKLRRDCPDDDWLHLVGLIHGLGKLLAHEDFGAEPQWAVVGETFPVGCRFQQTINHHQLFYANPDRRNRQHNSVDGIYRQGCGLHEVNFSWSSSEYLYLVMYLNGTKFPPEALFCIRYQKFESLFRGGYKNLLAYEDVYWMPQLRKLREASVWKRDEDILRRIHDDHQNKEMCDYYQGLVEKYIGSRRLFW